MHLYVHVPFCARRCSYCDFSIAVRRNVPDQRFVDAVLAEWRARITATAADALQTVYFGGGTPSRLAPAALAALLGGITRDRPLAPGAEVTIEVNPDDVNADAVAIWATAGINRASLGVQSHDPAVLEWMHRTHRAEQVGPAMALLRDGGIGNISVDLIFALPPEVRRDWDADVDRTLALEPSHVSLYGLTTEPHTPLARWRERGAVTCLPDEVYAAQYLAINRALRAADYEHYEVSNAALPGRRSRHNSMYWSGADYLGLGPSAHSLDGATRSWNIRAWEAYATAIEAGRGGREGFEVLGPRERELESAYLGLRTDAGLDRNRMGESALQQWVEAGWAEELGGQVRLRAEGWLRLDALVASLVDF
ncbi:MAG: radical SAM family heme chaperone HemW [Gemmatimonadales bacterium]|nr:radical SAM family heme chaperone HemW [Gemmatimonadales bacterium]